MNKQLKKCHADYKRWGTSKASSESTDLKLPSIHPFPKTNNQLIGWKASRKECSLELYGGYGPGNKFWGRKEILKRLKWPKEGAP
jgi:hypothetical protein